MNPSTDSEIAASTSPRLGWLRVFVWSIPVIYASFLLLTWDRVGPNDFDQFLVFHELQYWNHAFFGFAKQWTPLLCGGLSMAGEPQIPMMSLSMSLAYVVGPLLGIKLACVAYLAIGWVGAYLYAGLWRGDTLTRALAASLFIGNGFFVARIAVGHVDFVPFLTLPLALWGLHQALDLRPLRSGLATGSRAALWVGICGAGMAVVVDGSPVAVIHLLFWVWLYALVLSYEARSWAPCAYLLGATALAAVLDAGYLWPMLSAQAEFPRHTDNIFTDPSGLLLHAIVPLRGKLTHGSGKGHELTVFIGPVLAVLIWRYRAGLFSSLPRSMLKPLLIVSVVSIGLGMGSLRGLHVPVWLSPFDMLRGLPGFRSMGVTARYWGFLALPLSLLAAGSLHYFVTQAASRRVAVWLSVALALQWGMQAESFWSQWSAGRLYSSERLQDYFYGRRETVTYVAVPESHSQGERLKPTQGVANCYDMDDFVRIPVELGRQMHLPWAGDLHGKPWAMPDDCASRPMRVEWTGWSHLRLQSPPCSTHGARVIVLNQAWNSHWSAMGCTVLHGPSNRLALRCIPGQAGQDIDLQFADPVSDVGAAVSLRAWFAWAVLLSVVLTLYWARGAQRGCRQHHDEYGVTGELAP